MNLPELLVPAGTYRKAQVAIAYGADAIYVGATGFSMRPDGASFNSHDLCETVNYVHSQNKRIFVGINSLIMQDELPHLKQWLIDTKEIPFDALIVADPAAFMLVKEIRQDVEIHISTQQSTANSLAAKFWKQAGAHRIVLARECSLKEAKQISQDSELPIEIFVHGAMCVATSGRCLLSAYMTGKNASKGECKHSCRWEWEITEKKRPNESFPIIETDNKTIFLSSTDLCLIEHIPAIIESGVASLKIEGRMKSEYYVAAITRSYRAALDAYAQNQTEYQTDPQWLIDVNSVRHHPYSTGFAFGYPTENPDQIQATYIDIGTHDFVGIIDTYDNCQYTIQVKHPIRINDRLEWIAPRSQTGIVTVESILDGHYHTVEQAHPGTTAKIKFNEQDTIIPQHGILRRLKKVAHTHKQRIEQTDMTI
jgi:putative protease